MSYGYLIGTAVTLGVGAYTSSQNKKAQDKLTDAAGQPQDFAGDIRSYVKGYSKSLPGLLGTEKEFRPEFQKLNLKDAQVFGQGLSALNRKFGKTAANQLATARKKDLRNMTAQTGATRGLLQSLSPESAAMVAQAQEQALTAQRNAQGLTGQEARSAQQFAREGAADRGRVMDNSAMASEVLNRDSILGQKRQEANAATQNAFNVSQQMYSQPGLQALQQMPQSYQAGQNMLGLGMSGIGQGTPQLINPDMAVNMGAANKQNQFGAQSAAAQMNAANNAAMMNAAGNMFSSYMQYRK